MPRGQKLTLKLSLSLWNFPREDPSNLITRCQFINSPGEKFAATVRAAHKQPFFCYTSSFRGVKTGNGYVDFVEIVLAIQDHMHGN